LYKLDIDCITTLEAHIVEEDSELYQALLWHKQLGHLHFNALHKLSKTDAVNGMPKIPRIKHTCDTCQLGKLTRKTFSKSQRLTTAPLELIHSDLCGPIGNTSLTGARYFLKFFDDFSRKTWVYILKTKDQTYDKFLTFKAEVEKQTERKIKTLRTDIGGEYISKKFQEFYKREGIRHEKSQPHMPQSNGLAKRKNRTLVETTRCLCHQSSLPKYLWPEAIHAACYLLNRRPTSALNMKILEEVFTGYKPNMSNLRIFGTKVFVHIPKHKRTKMDATATRCILLGLDDLTKDYRCFCPRTKQILISRDVTVIESSPGSYHIGDEDNTTFPFRLFRLHTTYHNPGTITPTPHDILDNRDVNCSVPATPTPETSETQVQPDDSPLEHIELPSIPETPPHTPNQSLQTIVVPEQPNPIQVYRRRPLQLEKPIHARKSLRQKRPSVRLEGYVGSLEKTPSSFTEASRGPRWLAAM
jgi:transposase InsO family protein